MKSHLFCKSCTTLIDTLIKVLGVEITWLIKRQQDHLQFLTTETDILQYYLHNQLYLKDDILYSIRSEEVSYWNVFMGDHNNKGLQDPGFVFGLDDQQIKSFSSLSIEYNNAIYFLRFFSKNKLAELNNSIFNNAFAIKHFFNTQINHINNIDLAEAVKFNLKPLAISH
jgi:hypothetical protein